MTSRFFATYSKPLRPGNRTGPLTQFWLRREHTARPELVIAGIPYPTTDPPTDSSVASWLDQEVMGGYLLHTPGQLMEDLKSNVHRMQVRVPYDDPETFLPQLDKGAQFPELHLLAFTEYTLGPRHWFAVEDVVLQQRGPRDRLHAQLRYYGSDPSARKRAAIKKFDRKLDHFGSWALGAKWLYFEVQHPSEYDSHESLMEGLHELMTGYLREEEEIRKEREEKTSLLSNDDFAKMMKRRRAFASGE